MNAAAYRPDIDGLRAIAVLSVVFYHLHAVLVPGGFVGVDIFFVISGYLITRNIWGEMREGKFTFANFYLRRIRRIAPAFLVLVAATMVAGMLLLLPEDLARLSRSSLWSAFSMANVYFWRFLDVDYFAAASAEEPLLHLWSLGVEEQFYFVWPALLMVATFFVRRRNAALAIAATACVLSFWNAEATIDTAQKWAYYMLPPRGGELMLGALLAIARAEGPGRMPLVSRNVGEGLALVGFGLLGYGLYGLDDTARFPGINAFWPCLGSVLLIYAGEAQSRIVRAVLAPKPMVWVGLVSYSLYLWHWPILAFLRYFFGEISLVHGALALVAMSVLAFLSYRYVEKPARNWRPRPLKQVWALYGLPSLAIVAVSGVVIWNVGVQQRAEPSQAKGDAITRLEEETAPAYTFRYNCQQAQFVQGILADARCIVPEGATDKRTGMLLWGDSHAAHYIGVVGTLAKKGGFTFRNVAHSSCPPLFAEGYGEGSYRPSCDKFIPYMHEALESGAFRTVILAAKWDRYDENPHFRRDFERTVDELRARGLKVVVLGQVPVFLSFNRACEMRARGADCQGRQSRPDTGDSPTNLYLAGAAKAHGATYLAVRDVVCRDGTCTPYLDGVPVYFDSSHLSMRGSWRVGEHLLASANGVAWSNAIDRAGASPVPGAEARLVAVAGTPRFEPKRVTLLGGVSPSFAYHARSQKNIASLSGPSGVVLETWGARPAQIIAGVRHDFSANGFTEVRSSPSGDAIQMVFEKPGVPRVIVNVGPLKLPPQAPGADGQVYIRW